ncbi:prepilin peptidase [Vibrio breoganii]
MSLFCWATFFYIALSDLEQHRIPNRALVIVLLMQTASYFIHFDDMSWVLPSLLSGTLLFFIGLIFFFLKAMSPGDVKLLFVIGYVVGGADILELLFWLSMGGGCVAILFFLDDMSRYRPEQDPLNLIKSTFYRIVTRKIYKNEDKKAVGHQRYGDKLVMPFAPSLVIGLAMFYYFN